MTTAHQSADRQPNGATDTSEWIAGAAMLLVAAGPRRRLARQAAAPMACLPFLGLRCGGLRAASEGAGDSLVWATLPLASLFPWAAWLAAPRPVEPPAAGEPVHPRAPGHVPSHMSQQSSPGIPRPPAVRERGVAEPAAIAPVPTPTPSDSAPIELPSPRLAAPAPLAESPEREAAPPTLAPPASPSAASPPPRRPPADAIWPLPLPRTLAAGRPSPPDPARAGHEPAEHTWRPPLAARTPCPAADIVDPPAAPPRLPFPAPAATAPTLSAPPLRAPAAVASAPGSASRPTLVIAEPSPLPWPHQAATPRAEAPAPALDVTPPLATPLAATSTSMPQLLRSLRKVVEQTVVEEVERASTRLRAASASASTPTPAPAVATEIYSEYSVRKLMAVMRRLAQDDRLRGGGIA